MIKNWPSNNSRPAPHFAPRAKRVIFLCMRGGPSHVDTFDYKPKLSAGTGTGKPATRPGTKLLGSKWKFAQHGQSGPWISELFPNVAKHADELCLLRSMQTDLPAHPQAFLQLHTGSFQFVRPSLGDWTLYGLGTENEDLPGFVTLTPPAASGGSQNYGFTFLSAVYQGTASVRTIAPLALSYRVLFSENLRRNSCAKSPESNKASFRPKIESSLSRPASSG